MKTYGVLVSPFSEIPKWFLRRGASCGYKIMAKPPSLNIPSGIWTWLEFHENPLEKEDVILGKKHTHTKKTWRNLYARQGFSVAMVFRWRVIFIPTAHNIFPPPTPGRPLPKVSVVEAAFLNQCMAPAPSKTRRCCDLIRCWTESEHLQYSKNVQYECVVSWHGGFLK